MRLFPFGNNECLQSAQADVVDMNPKPLFLRIVNPSGRIQPWPENPFYWQYQGRPLLLLGGSVEDNLFQIPDLEAHLDLLASAGGNYVRCTMSSRDDGDVWPFEKSGRGGLYDLNQPGREYWERFERFLELTAERDIIAQIELWDRFDFAREPWGDNPFNPKNNVNYTAEESGLKKAIHTHPGKKENAFFRSVPNLDNNQAVLPFQHAFMDELLFRALPCGHLLYCMDNETNESPEWGAYWARYLHDKASRAGAPVFATEMWDAHSLDDGQHRNTWDHPELYSFVDVSQNNHNPPDRHWENLQNFRQKITATGRPRPMNSVKIYGANTGCYGSGRDAQERFWRNIFGGLASSRFHRPGSGIGLSARARAHIKSMRMLEEAVDLFRCQPHNELLSRRSYNEAYCAASPGRAYAVFFADGGDVLLDTSAAAEKAATLRWLDIAAGAWHEPQITAHEGVLRLVTPREEGYWAAAVTPAEG